MNSIPHPDSLPIEKRMAKRQSPLPTPTPTLAPAAVAHQCIIVSEILLTISKAVKCSKITGSPRELWRLADDVEQVGRQALFLSDELRRNAK